MNDNPFQQDTRQLLSYQLFAQDFFRHVAGGEASDDPSRVAELLGYETTEKSQVESSVAKDNISEDKSITRTIIESSSSPLKDFNLPGSALKENASERKETFGGGLIR